MSYKKGEGYNFRAVYRTKLQKSLFLRRGGEIRKKSIISHRECDMSNESFRQQFSLACQR